MNNIHSSDLLIYLKNNKNIILFNEANEKIEFKKIALINQNGNNYAILKVISNMSNIDEDGKYCFLIKDNNLVAITDSLQVKEIEKQYLLTFNVAEEKVLNKGDYIVYSSAFGAASSTLLYFIFNGVEALKVLLIILILGLLLLVYIGLKISEERCNICKKKLNNNYYSCDSYKTYQGAGLKLTKVKLYLKCDNCQSIKSINQLHIKRAHHSTESIIKDLEDFGEMM